MWNVDAAKLEGKANKIMISDSDRFRIVFVLFFEYAKCNPSISSSLSHHTSIVEMEKLLIIISWTDKNEDEKNIPSISLADKLSLLHTHSIIDRRHSSRWLLEFALPAYTLCNTQKEFVLNNDKCFRNWQTV